MTHERQTNVKSAFDAESRSQGIFSSSVRLSCTHNLRNLVLTLQKLHASLVEISTSANCPNLNSSRLKMRTIANICLLDSPYEIEFVSAEFFARSCAHSSSPFHRRRPVRLAHARDWGQPSSGACRDS
jgi:hypothetical protein